MINEKLEINFTREQWRLYMAIHAPVPTQEQINAAAQFDRARNPHNDTYKPQQRSPLQIEWDLRLTWADAGLQRIEQTIKGTK